MKLLILCTLAVASSSAFDLRGAELKQRNIVVPVLEPEGRITNGNTAVPGQFPYIVGIAFRTEKSGHWCGGSIIDKEWVLTAAHCTAGTLSATLFLGASSQRTLATVQHTVSAENMYTHSKYNAATVNNDIALIKMPSTPFSPLIGAVSLPALSGSYSTYTGDEALSCGWGQIFDGSGVSNTLQYAIFEIISNLACAKTFGPLITSSKLCVDAPHGVSTCQGDSGGPLMTAGNVQVGIVSFGSSKGCTKGYPAAFTRVTSYLDWISSTSGI